LHVPLAKETFVPEALQLIDAVAIVTVLGKETNFFVYLNNNNLKKKIKRLINLIFFKK
jgi:hypothetical protein